MALKLCKYVTTSLLIAQMYSQNTSYCQSSISLVEAYQFDPESPFFSLLLAQGQDSSPGSLSRIHLHRWWKDSKTNKKWRKFIHLFFNAQSRLNVGRFTHSGTFLFIFTSLRRIFIAFHASRIEVISRINEVFFHFCAFTQKRGQSHNWIDWGPHCKQTLTNNQQTNLMHQWMDQVWEIQQTELSSSHVHRNLQLVVKEKAQHFHGYASGWWRCRIPSSLHLKYRSKSVM